MKRTLLLSAILGLLAPIVLLGCGEETKVVEEKKVVTPGGSTTEKVTKEIDKTGDHKDKP